MIPGALPGASIRGRLPPPAKLAQQEEYNNMRMKRTDSPTILGATWRLANANSSMQTTRTPHAYTKYIEREERGLCCILLRLEIEVDPFAHHTVLSGCISLSKIVPHPSAVSSND